jgi:hypothetical protein
MSDYIYDDNSSTCCAYSEELQKKCKYFQERKPDEKFDEYLKENNVFCAFKTPHAECKFSSEKTEEKTEEKIFTFTTFSGRKIHIVKNAILAWEWQADHLNLYLTRDTHFRLRDSDEKMYRYINEKMRI